MNEEYQSKLNELNTEIESLKICMKMIKGISRHKKNLLYH